MTTRSASRPWHIAVTLAFIALSLWAGTARAEGWTTDDTHAAIEAVEPAYRGWVKATIACETGHTFDPYATNWNDSGYGPSRGVAQINERLQGAHYRASGFTDPYNPYEAVTYLWQAFRGDYRAQSIGWWRWSCA